MKELDFLPRSFHEAARRRRRTRRNLLYSLAVVTSLAVLHGLTRSEIRSAQAALVTFREGAGLRGAQRERLIGLRQMNTGLQARADLLCRLEDDAPLDAVIAEITRLMSPGVALRSLSVRRTAPAEVGPAEVRGGLPVGHSVTATPGGPAQQGRMEAVLQGVAPSDVDVGTYFGRLSGCPLLEGVPLVVAAVIALVAGSLVPFVVVLALQASIHALSRATAPAAPETEPGWGSAVLMGVAQALAILPGITRSGSTVLAGLWRRVDPERAAEFSFLMSIPAILGAAVLSLPELGTEAIDAGAANILVGSVGAAVAGVLAIRFFVGMLRRRSFHLFSYYCWIAAGLYLLTG